MAQIARTLGVGRSTLYEHLELADETAGSRTPPDLPSNAQPDLDLRVRRA